MRSGGAAGLADEFTRGYRCVIAAAGYTVPLVPANENDCAMSLLLETAGR